MKGNAQLTFQSLRRRPQLTNQSRIQKYDWLISYGQERRIQKVMMFTRFAWQCLPFLDTA